VVAKTGQYDDLDGAAWGAIIDDDASVAVVDRPVNRPTERRSSEGAVSSSIDLRQLRGKDVRYRLMMSPDDLVEKCNEAMRLGVDFPTLWHTIIKCDPTSWGRRSSGWKGIAPIWKLQCCEATGSSSMTRQG
jgi:nitrogen fixation-related uncharacterized protein